MGGIVIKHRGDFSKTQKFFNRMKYGKPQNMFEKYGKLGVEALMNATPVDTGLTASSWYYTISQNKNGWRIDFRNSNIQNGWVPVAILLQYGHATRNGGWVEGKDYINPAIQPLFDKLANDAWEEVVST